MSDLDENKLRRLDPTVLLVFLGLMRTRKAMDVAGQLGLTNSSISHALRRLRDVFEDELFLRRPHGLEPTAFAIRIEPDIRRAVDALQSALSGPPAFSPRTADLVLRLAANDREVAGMIPQVLARIGHEAPGLKMSIQSLSRAAARQGLTDGNLDLAIGYFPNVGPEIDASVIRTESYLVTARKDHPIWDNDLSLDSYTRAQHILVSTDGSMSGIVDQALKERGRSRSVRLAIPSFLPALSILRRTDFIATMPAGLVRHHAEHFGLRCAEPPLTIRPFEVSILCHRRNRKNPIHQWCIEKFFPET
ncbi:MAG: LysR family transcriptional regulator [Pseudomonadota bacterium]